ncbi:UvsX-like recombinase [Pseudomonas phage vB_PpuM-Voja-6]
MAAATTRAKAKPVKTATVATKKKVSALAEKLIEDAKVPAKRGANKAAAAKVEAPPKSREDMVDEILEMMGVTAMIDEVEEHFNIVQGVSDLEILREGRVSTGMLCTDLMLAGGIYPGGWYNFSGPEGSGKSTNLMSWLGSICLAGVPMSFWWDYENTGAEDYIVNMLEAQGIKISMKRMFGVKDDKGNYVVPPRVRYYNESSGEKFYKVMSSILKKLPDKVHINGEWYLLYDRTKENMSKFKGKYTVYKGKLRMKSPNGGMMQCLILLDSIASMTTEEDEGEDGDGSRGMALDARMHSKHIKKVWGRLRKKMATVVSINQIRQNPGMRMGNPNYEPGGMAIKHATGARIMQTPRACPDFISATGATMEEPSVGASGTDTYRFINMKAIKNKYGVDNLEIWQRLWISDASGKGRGFDPVWDTWYYLRMTGQLSGNMKTFTLHADSKSIPELDLTWEDLKQLVLFKGKSRKELTAEWEVKDFDIREVLAAQISSGRGLELYFNHLSGAGLDEEEEEVEDE